MVVPVIVLVAVAALALALLTGHGPRFGQLAASQPRAQGPALPQALTAAAFGGYPGQQQRGVFQTINRIVASGNTIVTMGSQTSDGLIRQQFFVSTNGGATWRLAPVQAPGGGQAPLGHQASLLAGGPGGWAAIGPQALWTSQDGVSWTLAAAHGITPQQAGDSIWVMTRTAQGYLAAGNGSAGGGASQAVIWTSPDGVTWHRMTAAQLGLPSAGERVLNISYATWLGGDTVISGEVAANGTTYSGVWLSTNGGSAWTRVSIPADHGAGPSITGLAFDSAGLIAVRPGRAANGADDGVAYFSPNGRTWSYAGTIDMAGGWTPGVVKGSAYGFVVAGTSAAGRLVAYTSSGDGATWQPTGPLGDAADESVVGATVAPAGTIVAVGYTAESKLGQQAMLVEANTAGNVRPISLAGIPGGVIPELTVNGLAVAGGQQVAVGSADGYPAVWLKGSGNSWALVSTLTSVPAGTGLRDLTGVAHGSAGWLAVGAPGPYVATSADGRTWQFATGPGSITDDLAGVAAVATTAGPVGYIIVGKLVAPGGNCVADVWWSPNLTFWVRAHDVNDATGSSQVLAVAAGAHGFVSAGSHDGRPGGMDDDRRPELEDDRPGHADGCHRRRAAADHDQRRPRGRAGPGVDRGRSPAVRRAVRRRGKHLAAGAVQVAGTGRDLHRPDRGPGRLRGHRPIRRARAAGDRGVDLGQRDGVGARADQRPHRGAGRRELPADRAGPGRFHRHGRRLDRDTAEPGAVHRDPPAAGRVTVTRPAPRLVGPRRGAHHRPVPLAARRARPGRPGRRAGYPGRSRRPGPTGPRRPPGRGGSR